MYKKLLSEKAIKALENSYAPYSSCNVGAALLCKNGKIYSGCNIENASFSATVCAERVAFFKALSEGEREFEAIAIAGQKQGDMTAFSPCGVCRQVMAEFCLPEFKIIVVVDKNEFVEYSLNQLLPNSFTLKEN